MNLAAAGLARGEQHLGVHAVFGELRISLPKNLGAMVSGNCLFGEVITLNQRKGGIGSEILYRTENHDSIILQIENSTSLHLKCSGMFGYGKENKKG
jgi:predicted membrane protein